MRTVLASLAEGGTVEEIMADFPTPGAAGLTGIYVKHSFTP